MSASEQQALCISGLGVVSAVGHGASEFATALFAGRSRFRLMQRDGRAEEGAIVGAEIERLQLPHEIAPQLLRNSSLSVKAALCAADEAWQDAGLANVDPCRIGLIVGGSNIQQRELVLAQRTMAASETYVSPTYGFAYLDTDICGACSQHLGLKGPAFTVGAASASGQLAVIQAALAVLSGEVDVCIALGALADVSHWECRALQALGAMSCGRYEACPQESSRPFDGETAGFVFGEACAVVVVERIQAAEARRTKPYARLAGWSAVSEAHRLPDASLEGEIRAIENTLRRAGLNADRIDYVNPHGTGAVLGDEIELDALAACGLTEARINTTKSITGHGLSSAGIVELVATLLQMRRRRLHGCRNLRSPIQTGFNWVGEASENASVTFALNLSHGFGGFNSALCVERFH